MLDALKPLLQSGLVNEATRDAINEAWQNKIKEVQTQVRAEIREEFAGRYEHDRELMIKTLDQMVTETLTTEIQKVKEEQVAVAKLKVQTVKEMRSAAEKFNNYMTRALAEELAELAQDRKQYQNNIAKLENFVIKSLAEEINEFAQDKQELRETRVRLISEARRELDAVKQKFVERSGAAVSKIVAETLNHEITQLHEDIKAARENNFGRKIFEAFSNEFLSTYLNENAAVRELRTELQKTQAKLQESRREIAAKTRLVESKQRDLKIIAETAERNKIIAELLGPLDKSKRGIMGQLLESVQTTQLRSAYDRYLPAVLNNKTQPETKVAGRAVLQEATGNKEVKVVPIDENSLSDIKRLAGLQK